VTRSGIGAASASRSSVDGARVDLRPIELHLVGRDVAARVVPPPADAITSEERALLASSEPLSLLRVLGPEGQEGGPAGRRAGRLIREHIAAGYYADRGPVLAIHELCTPTHRQVGLVAGIPVEDVRAGVVRPHEQTRAYREERLAAFLDAAGVDVSPVVLTHAAEPAIDALVVEARQQQPALEFDGWGDVRHRVWIVDDASRCDEFHAAAGAIAQLTIVDGHHRVAAALRAHEGSGDRGPADRDEAVLLAELVADRDLRMVGFDRRVRVGDIAEARRILTRLSDVATLTDLGIGPPPRPTGAAEMLVATSDRWWRATFTDVPEPLPDSLPVSLLQERVLGPIVGIGDPRTDRRLEHVPGLGDLRALDRSVHEALTLAFVPRAVTVAELQAVARRGEVLPPKSTYVDPKPGPGVLIRLRSR
jgi:uncharacterized protein (DUF1015 family)